MLNSNAGKLKLYLLSTKACAGANGSEVLLLPLVAHLVGFTIVVARRRVCVGMNTNDHRLFLHIFLRRSNSSVLTALTWFTLELSFAISQTCAAHRVTIL